MAAAGADRVEAAIDAGLLRVDGERVRASHPLLGAAARQRAGASRAARAAPGARRRRRRPGAARPASRARHPAARRRARRDGRRRGRSRAAARGARQEAVLLAEHALRLTPADAAERPERLLALAALPRARGRAAARHGSAHAGARRPARRAAARAGVDRAVRGRRRAHPRRHRAPPGRRARRGRRRPRACAPSSWPGAPSHMAGFAVADLGAGEALAREALDAGGRRRERAAGARRAGVGRVALRGRPVDELCARFRAVSDAASFLAESPERTAEQRLVWRGELASARAGADDVAHASPTSSGEPVSYALQRLHLCELQLRAGDVGRGRARCSTSGRESAEAELLVQPMYERCRALARGGPRAARRGRGVGGAGDRRAPPSVGVGWDRLEALRARGAGAAARARARRGGRRPPRGLGAHASSRASTSPASSRSRRTSSRRSSELGELDEARAVIERLRAARRAEQEHPWARASARRCARAVALALGGTTRTAAGGARGRRGRARARSACGFDRARALLALGRALRRRRAVAGGARARWSGRRRRSTRWARRLGGAGARRAGPRRRPPRPPRRRAHAGRASRWPSWRSRGAPTRRSPRRSW